MRDKANPAGDIGSVRSFYDEYVEEHVPYHRSPRGLKRLALTALPYWSYREWKFWERSVPQCDTLVDLGCARGREVFADKARRTIGVDLAGAALVDCVGRYQGGALAALEMLPLPDASVDCVVSSHVLGHVPPSSKSRVFGEINRVLKSGGATVHVIETESSRPLIRNAKQHRELYRRRLIDPDGHVGLEAPSAALKRFEDAGLQVERIEKMDARTLHPRLWIKWFDNEYREIDPEIDSSVARAGRTLRSPLRLAACEVGLGLWHQTLGQWLPDVDEAMFLAVSARKP